MSAVIDIPVTWMAIAILTGMMLLLMLIINHLLKALASLKNKHKSIYTRHGLMAEQFLPFASKFPGTPRNFRFLGSPVDGVSFEDDKVLIIEFKTGKSRLSEKQKHIRHLIDSGKVYFKEVRMP
tara:strand:- start:3 stop:374 length:372 start_codon:yes stop_codon:yes gene_type:complete